MGTPAFVAHITGKISTNLKTENQDQVDKFHIKIPQEKCNEYIESLSAFIID